MEDSSANIADKEDLENVKYFQQKIFFLVVQFCGMSSCGEFFPLHFLEDPIFSSSSIFSNIPTEDCEIKLHNFWRVWIDLSLIYIFLFRYISRAPIGTKKW